MKKFVLISLLICFSISLKADDNAALQMRLAQQTKFQQRVAFLLMKEAFVVLAENPATSNHANRFNFALLVRNNVNSVIQNGYVVALVGRPNLISETTTCDDAGPNPTFECVTSALDSEIASQIATDWNLWSNNQ